jgi:3-methyladenine DNA glycosylase/8-oxoguanine DNA glycosylase
MRPAFVRLHRKPTSSDAAGLRPMASAQFLPRGEGYDPRVRLKRRLLALRGGESALVLAFRAAPSGIRVDVLARGTCTGDDVEQAIATARRGSAVDDDPTDFFAMVRSHPLLGPLSRRVDPRLSLTPTVFESFTVSVIEQLVTGFEARASVRRLWQIAGERVPGTKLIATPTPSAVRRVPMWKMHAIGVGSRRAAALREGAIRGDALERLRAGPPDLVVDKLQSLPGIGPWTANAVARDGIGWPDAVPVGDFHAPFFIASTLGGRDDLTRDDPRAADAAMLELLEPFRPHRARVALLIERHVAGTSTYRLPRIDPHRREPWKY